MDRFQSYNAIANECRLGGADCTGVATILDHPITGKRVKDGQKGWCRNCAERLVRDETKKEME